MTNILLVSFHSNNRGDESALRGLMASLKEAIPNVKFTVLASDPEISAEVFKAEGISILDWFPPIIPFRLSNFASNQRINIILNIPLLIGQGVIGFFDMSKVLLWAIFARLGKQLRLGIDGKKLKILKKMVESDLVLFSPAGPYFGDIYLYQVPIQVVQALLAKILNKPVMICAPSMGPFYKSKWISKIILNKVDVISLREEISMNMVSNLDLSNPFVCVTADCGVLQHPSDVDIIEKLIPVELGKNRKGPIVGITVYSAVQSYIDYTCYKRTMAEIADYVINELHAKVVFVPQWYGRFSDIPLITEVVSLMRFKEEVYITPEDYRSDQMHGIFGQLDLIIATRYHSAVLGSTMNVPCVLISYEHKAKGFMHLLGLNDCILEISELNIENLIRKVNMVWAMRDHIKSLLPAQIKQIQKRALFNVTIAVDLLNFYKKSHSKEHFKEYFEEKTGYGK